MNTYESKEKITVTQTTPQEDQSTISTFAEKAKELFQTVGEKIGLVDPSPSSQQQQQKIGEKVEQAKDKVTLAGQHVGWEAKAKFHDVGEKTEQLKDDAQRKLYDVGGKAGFVFPYTDTTGLPRPMSTEHVIQELQEARKDLGLVEPEETVPENGRGPFGDPRKERPLSSEKVIEEILEVRENLGLEEPAETIPESGKATTELRKKNLFGNETEVHTTKTLPA